MGDEISRATLSVWGGEDGKWEGGATQAPVVFSVAYGYPDVESWLDVALGRAPGHIYSRNTNPTVHAFEEKVRVLEGAAAATSFATGMAAISNTLFTLLAPGDRIVSVKDTYGGTNKIFTEFLPRWGVQVTLCDTSDHEQIEAAIAEGCRVVYLESPTNPTLKVLDLARLAAAGHRAGAVVVTDNTFATPINQNPLQLGSDLVIHSATKFLGGHADALGGVVCGDPELVGRIYHFREINGATLDPMAAYLLLRGMKTLHLRVRQQNESALRIARWLSEQPEVAAVYYPGLAGHTHHDVARRQMPRLRRRAQLHARRRLPGGRARAAAAALGAPRRQPGGGRDCGRAARDDQPCGVHGGRARGDGDPRGPDPLLGGHRGRR